MVLLGLLLSVDAITQDGDLVGEVVEAGAEHIAQVTVSADVVGEFSLLGVPGLVRSHVDAVDAIQIVAITNVLSRIVIPTERRELVWICCKH